MTILLTILKVIGIILLVLLGIVLALLLLVLFFPVTYGIRGKIEEEVHIKGKVSWLFSLISVKVDVHNKEVHARLSILGFIKKDLYPVSGKASAEDDSDRKEDSSEETLPSIQVAQLEETPPDDSSQDDDIQAEEETENKSKNKDKKKAAKKDGKSLKKYLPWNIIKIWLQKIKSFFISIKQKLSDIKKILSDETNKNAVKAIWNELKRTLRRIGPRRGRADLRFALGDPAATGKVTAVISVLPFVYKKGVHIQPDFMTEKMYVKGTFKINGHIIMSPFLGTAFRLFKNKDIRSFINKFK